MIWILYENGLLVHWIVRVDSAGGQCRWIVPDYGISSQYQAGRAVSFDHSDHEFS
ncbi:MAG: hypothetical protein ABSD50_14805 [Smithella sp.]